MAPSEDVIMDGKNDAKLVDMRLRQKLSNTDCIRKRVQDGDNK